MAKPKKNGGDDDGDDRGVGHNYSKEERAKKIRKVFNDWARQKKEKDKLNADHRERNNQNKAHLAELDMKSTDAKLAYRLWDLKQMGDDEKEGQEMCDIAVDTFRECFEAMTGDQLDLFTTADAAKKAREAQAERASKAAVEEATL